MVLARPGQFDYLDISGLPADPPFDYTWVKKMGNAYWHGNGDSSDSNGVASDGLGDPEIPTDDGNGGTSSGTHYEKKDTGGGSFTVSTSPRASVACSTSTNSSAETMGYENTSFAAVDVGLPLISSDIENSARKGGAPNARARDGSMSVDSVAIYDSVTGVWRGDTTLTASSPFDDALFTWHANGGSPSPYDLSNNLGIPSRFLSSISLDMGLCPTSQGLPMTTGVGATVASQTDASATDRATYTINWHAPYEAYQGGLSTSGKDPFEELVVSVSPGLSGDKAASNGGKLNFEVFAEAVMLGFGLSGPDEIVGLVEVVCHICHLTQFALDYVAEPEVNLGATSGDGTWGVAQSDHNITGRWANDPQGWHHCNMTVWRVAYWGDQHYDCDKYGHNGWICGSCDCHAKQYYRMADEPFFEDDGS